MKDEVVYKLRKIFEDYVHNEENVEFWFARDLQKLLDYNEWRNFINVIGKAKISCQNSGQQILDHFVEINKKVKIGSDSEREIFDYKLTRYACYLIAQNGDPRKDEIAFAQSYFAVQTRKQELIQERIRLQERFSARDKLTKSETELSKLLYERDVDDKGFARIRSKGDYALFGGNSTKQMKKKLNIPFRRSMADFLPTVTIAAKNFATEITNFNVKKEDIKGEPKITKEHIKNNLKVRYVLVEDNIYPEKLPPEEDIKKLERKIKHDENELANNFDK